MANEKVDVYVSEVIAHDRQDIPKLLSEIERLKQELNKSKVKEMELITDKAYEKSQKLEYIKTVHLLNKENKRLREVLEGDSNKSTFESSRIITICNKCNMPNTLLSDGVVVSVYCECDSNG